MRNLWLLFVVGLATGFISEKLLVSSQSPSSTADDLYLEGRTSGDFPIDDEDGDDDGSGSGSGDNFFRDAEEMLKKFLSDTIFNKDVLSSQPQPTESSHHNPPTTAADSENPPTTEERTETTPLFPGEEVPGETTDSWFVHGASPSSTSPPSSETMTTKFSKDISVTKDADKDNELDDSTDKVIEEDIVRQDVNEVLAVDDRGRKTYDLADPEQVTSENMWERTEVLAAVIACGVVGFLCAVFLLLLLAYRMKKKDEGSYDLGDNKPSATAYQKAPTKEFYA